MRSANAEIVQVALADVFEQSGNGEALFLAREISDFGKWVRSKRLTARLTQEEVAKEAGLSRTTVANLEAGLVAGGPRLITAIRILRACDLRMTYDAIGFRDDDFEDTTTAPLLSPENGISRRILTTVVKLKARKAPA